MKLINLLEKRGGALDAFVLGTYYLGFYYFIFFIFVRARRVVGQDKGEAATQERRDG